MRLFGWRPLQHFSGRLKGAALSLICLSALYPLSLQAQQLYVRNQPFEGAVVREAGGLWVDLVALQRALGFESTLEAEGARVQGKLVRTRTQGETVLVSLSQVAAALGAVVREDPQFNTVDVHLAVRPKAGAGLEISGSSDFPSDENTPEPSGEKVQTAAYNFVLPEGMQVTRDPRMIKSFLESGGGGALENDFKLDAMVYFKDDPKFKKGAAVFTWFLGDVPPGMEDERTLLAYQSEAVASILHDMNVRLVDVPQVVTTGGQRFVLGAGVTARPPHKGLMALLRIDAKRKRFYQVLASDITQSEEKPTTDFMRLLSSVTTK